MNVYVTTYKKYYPLVRIFAHLFNKFWSIWDREYLISSFKQNRSPWQVETNGCNELKDDGELHISTNETPIIKCAPSTVRKGNLDAPINFNFLNDRGKLGGEHIRELIELGYIDENNRIII